ncbi:MAG: single-stranded DNA-binding protein [Bacteroidales bacterium]|nr:single-stranded DNA-binding protein [Bacteroidales bacterium]MBR3652333.1 single-stranded DNA-binding protein [Bacteroidales bacterium]
MSLNKVMLIGNVGRDPNVRYLEGNNPGAQGRKVATFTLATTERFRDRNGETRENTEWHNIVAWGQPADVCERFVHKGTQLYIEGRLRTRKYTDSQGVEKYTTEINVDTLQLLGRRDDNYQSDQQQGGYQQGGGYQGGGYQRQGGYQQQGGGYQSQGGYQQNAYQRPAPPVQPVQPPVQPAQPAPAVPEVEENPNDDLPF